MCDWSIRSLVKKPGTYDLDESPMWYLYHGNAEVQTFGNLVDALPVLLSKLKCHTRDLQRTVVCGVITYSRYINLINIK